MWRFQNSPRKDFIIMSDHAKLIRKSCQHHPKIMKKNPIGIGKDELAAKALALMANKNITSLCVYNKKNKLKTIGVLHIHNILQSNIS